MAHSVLIKKVDTSVFAQMECLVIHTKKVAFWIKLASQVNVATIKIVLTHWHAFREHVLAHARVYCADKMPIVNQKTMLLGVGVALALLKMNMANVYHVCYFFFFLRFHKKKFAKFSSFLFSIIPHCRM